jgi:hypothetical protein
MVLQGVEARTIKMAWPCFYPHVGNSDNSERRLWRDMTIIKKDKELVS